MLSHKTQNWGNTKCSKLEPKYGLFVFVNSHKIHCQCGCKIKCISAHRERERELNKSPLLGFIKSQVGNQFGMLKRPCRSLRGTV